MWTIWLIDRLLTFQSLAQYLSYPPHNHTPISHTNSFVQLTLYLRTAEPHISSLSPLTPFRRSHSLCSPSVHGCWYTVSFCTGREGQEHGVTYCPEHLCMHIKHILWTQNTVKHNTGMRRITTFWSMTDRIYGDGPIISLYHCVTIAYSIQYSNSNMLYRFVA